MIIVIVVVQVVVVVVVGGGVEMVDVAALSYCSDKYMDIDR